MHIYRFGITVLPTPKSISIQESRTFSVCRIKEGLICSTAAYSVPARTDEHVTVTIPVMYS